MRKLLVAILTLAGASLLMPVCEVANADEVQMFYRDAKTGSRAARPARLRSAAAGDPDTVWIGHVHDPSFTAGGTMSAGGYGPYHVGRGNNMPVKSGGKVFDNGTWDFDKFQAGETDSLMGWWPLARPYSSGNSSKGDYRRSFFCFDYGNQVNYVINQGGPVDANGNKRTFGVTGLWHRDAGNLTNSSPDTIPNTNVQRPTWSPADAFLGGAGSTASAWMGMRTHGDLSHRDQTSLGGTGNPFNASLMQYQVQYPRLQIGSNNSTGTDQNFPGYGSQLDQMLYRDIVLAADTDPLVISFNFSVHMSKGAVTLTGARGGWFDKDPLSLSYDVTTVADDPTLDGNFVSTGTTGPAQVIDSFMVYVGAPVNDNSVLLSNWDGVSAKPPVYDKKRRWFSEVLQLNHACEKGNPCSIIGKELRSYYGDTANSVTINVGTEFGAALINQICDADGVDGNGGPVRLVFRVKTNRQFDDEGGDGGSYSSGTRGAAIVDNVVVNSWAAANGNFESPSSIDNRTTTAATAAWKSTGKPPSVFWHTDNIATLDFDDPCGGLDDPKRRCNLYGAVANAGDHDLPGHANSGGFGTNSQDRQRWFGSPTINLKNTGVDGQYNAMGIDADIANPSNDIVLFGSEFIGDFVNAISETGNFRSIGWQSYPARQRNGAIGWGQIIVTTSIFFNGSPAGCFEGSLPPEGAIANQQIRTSNSSGIPDSLRVFIHRISRCYNSGALDEAHCSPTGFGRGSYYDNLAVGLVDGAPPALIDIAIWNLINDAFVAANRWASPPAPLTPAQWDTAGAQIRIGANLAANAVVDLSRPNISGDSVLVSSGGANVRMDMVFRILPGPGNYSTKGDRASQLKQSPAVATLADPVSPPTNLDFFGNYMISNGQFGTPGGHPGQGTLSARWNKNVWNSARMDSADANLFKAAGNQGLLGTQAPGIWSGTYHESDPKFSSLGILKHICVMPDPDGSADSDNIRCDGIGFNPRYNPASSGWNGVNTTKEFTKIIPDGLLTPGSHVQYFFRRSKIGDPATVYEMGPDTNLVFPQDSEASFDGHRWQQFGVLPDRWKSAEWDAAYQNASAPACMLYVDWCDRRINELVWVAIADSIGATKPARYGAHNGWHAKGNFDLGNDPDLRDVIGTANDWGVYAHGGQPGTIWDMYGVKASESSTTSSSLGNGTAAEGYQRFKDDARGPTGRMLRYYRVVMILTGDINVGNIGPYEDKTSDDLGLLSDFTAAFDNNGDTPKPRGVLGMGTHLIEGLWQIEPHYSWALGFFGAEAAYITVPTFSLGNYRYESGYAFDVAELDPQPPIQPLSDPSRYSVFNDCTITNDVMLTSGQGQAVGYYPATNGGANTWISSVYAPALPAGSPAHEGVTLIEGFDIANLGSLTSLTSTGRFAYFTRVLTNLYAAMCPAMALGNVSVGGENPNLVNFLALRSENPHRGGDARLSFGITRKEKVELKVYDVTGRLVKVLANREFAAGEHTIFWDGSDESGRLVPRGVYFYQLRTPSFVSQKKLAVLKH